MKATTQAQVASNRISGIISLLIDLFVMLTDVITWALKGSVKQIQEAQVIYQERKVNRIRKRMTKNGYSLHEINEEIAMVRNKEGVWTILKRDHAFFAKLDKALRFMWKHLNKIVGVSLILGTLAKIGQAITPWVMIALL